MLPVTSTPWKASLLCCMWCQLVSCGTVICLLMYISFVLNETDLKLRRFDNLSTLRVEFDVHLTLLLYI